MLVKRIAEHIRRQDWTAVAIEFLIVVIGIYAAFELDRWRDLEAERRANKNFIRMLSLELEEKLPEAGNRIDSYRELQDEQDSVITWLNGDKPTSAFTEEMCYATFRSLVLNWSATRLETVEFMGTGDWVQGVQDNELGRLLLALGSTQERADGAYSRFVLQIVNLSDLYPELLRRRDTSAGQYREGLVCDALGMRKSQAFKNQLFGNIGRHSALQDIRQDEFELLQKIAARVDELRL